MARGDGLRDAAERALRTMDLRAAAERARRDAASEGTYNQGCPKCRKPFARQAVKRKARRELRSAGVQGWDLGA